MMKFFLGISGLLPKCLIGGLWVSHYEGRWLINCLGQTSPFLLAEGKASISFEESVGMPSTS